MCVGGGEGEGSWALVWRWGGGWLAEAAFVVVCIAKRRLSGKLKFGEWGTWWVRGCSAAGLKLHIEALGLTGCLGKLGLLGGSEAGGEGGLVCYKVELVRGVAGGWQGKLWGLLTGAQGCWVMQ